MNELILLNSVEKRLRLKREPPVFPLSPTHRQELRKLRDTNIGNLRERLGTIERLKREEYQKKYVVDIEKELLKHENTAKFLNADWEDRLVKINKILADRKKLEEKTDRSKLSLLHDYGDVNNLEKIKDDPREFRFERKPQVWKVVKEEFDEKYGKKFDAVRKRIDALVTYYEEAINFGDLEIVKELYYTMKGADNFFVDVSNLQV
jgi:hypothetical protein